MTSIDTVKDSFQKLQALAEGEKVQLELSLNEAERFSASYQDLKLKKYESDLSTSATLRVLKGAGVGIATTENLSFEALKKCFQQALQTAYDLDNGIDVQTLIEKQDTYPVLSLSPCDFSEISVEQKLKWAEMLESEALKVDPKVKNVSSSRLTFKLEKRQLLNSNGLNLSYQMGYIQGHCSALAKEDGVSKSGYDYFICRTAQDLPISRVTQTAARNAVELLASVQPKSGQYATVLSSEVAADFVAVLADHLSAQKIVEGVSRLKDKMGTVVLSAELDIIDDPLDSNLTNSRPFDDEGAPSQITPLFEKGTLKNYLTNSFYARKLKLNNTGHARLDRTGLGVGHSNLKVKPGKLTFEELVSLSPEVLVVESISGLHSGLNTTTGDFSLPASGSLYKAGVKTLKVDQFVIAGNIFDALKSVTQVSSRVNTRGESIQCPDLFVPQLSVAGQK